MSLFEMMMRGNWDEIVETYRGEDRRLKITESGDTAMHVAVRLGKTEHVRKMIGKIGEDEALEILSVKNERGNTALHVAAELGNVVACCCIATKDLRLLAVTDNDGATPLYVSVANGKKEAFFYLDFLLQKSRRESRIDYSFYKRNNGYTILHTAVFRGYFGLAIQIVEIYPDLVNFVDDIGGSPLHILAGKKVAFESCTFRGPIDRILLPYIQVEQLVKEEKKRHVINLDLMTSDVETTLNLPQIHQIINDSSLSFHQGNGKRKLKFLCVTVISILFTTIAFIWHVSWFLVKTFLKLAGFGWLDIHYLIKYGLEKRNSLREKKTRWILARILLEDLVCHSSMYRSDLNPHISPHDHGALSNHQQDESKKDEPRKMDTPFLIASKRGVLEVVNLILNKFPVAAFDVDSELKNAAMLAADTKRVGFYEFLAAKYPETMKRMMVQLDKQGNSVLHHCAKFHDEMVLYTPEPASYLRAEYSWYKEVKEKTPPEIVALQNLSGLTADDVFIVTHQELIRNGSEWLLKTSESCSVVAALIATVAFATSAVDTPAVGSYNPKFVGVSAFDFYCFSGLMALCFSIFSLLYFLALRTSSFRVIDFAENLPMKLFLGLMLLLLSMVSILVSFCFRHYSMLENATMRKIAIPIYILTSIRVLSLAASQLPFYHGAFFRSKFRPPM